MHVIIDILNGVTVLKGFTSCFYDHFVNNQYKFIRKSVILHDIIFLGSSLRDDILYLKYYCHINQALVISLASNLILTDVV